MFLKFFACLTLMLFWVEAFAVRISIYKDDGVNFISFQRTCDFFKSLGNIVEPINADTLVTTKDWMSKYDKIIIPGGADCPYHRKLKGIGCSNIKEFVKNGGTYIGICAGAYFGCRKVEFALGTDLEVNEDRELAFFQGVASGPMLNPYVYDSEKGASAAKVRSLIDGSVFYAYHNGGCSFVVDETNKFNVEVLAVYADANDSPAIIKCQYGKGQAILSGVHYEADFHSLLSTGEDLEIITPIAEKIEFTNEFRKKFLSNLL